MAAPWEESPPVDGLAWAGQSQDSAPGYGCRISPPRIAVMTLVSMGTYWFYWMYRTWAHYRDHTAGLPEQDGKTHYPVWHGLTQFLPIYGFFRFHAHVRVYKELMAGRGVPDSLNAPALVSVVVINAVVGLTAGLLRGESDGPGVSSWTAMWYVISLGTLLVSIGVLHKVQSSLNQYWASVGGPADGNARFGKGEILCIILGILFWIGVIGDFIFW